MKEKTHHYKKIAYVLFLSITLTVLFCILWIFSGRVVHNSHASEESVLITADIYQDGTLLQSISLDAVTESYTFIVEGENNCRNEIEVRHGSIGIISASCPDKLCVHQGFIDSSLLPIICLPNRLVIQIRIDDTASDTAPTLDIMSY